MINVYLVQNSCQLPLSIPIYWCNTQKIIERDQTHNTGGAGVETRKNGKKEKESFINNLIAEIQSGWSGKDSTISDWIKSLKEKLR